MQTVQVPSTVAMNMDGQGSRAVIALHLGLPVRLFQAKLSQSRAFFVWSSFRGQSNHTCILEGMGAARQTVSH